MGSRVLSTLHVRPVAVQSSMAFLSKDKLPLMAWSLQCSVSCGSGVRKRSVACRGDQGSLLHATACSFEDQPPLIEPCVHDDCPVLNDQAWHIGAWSLVSACLPPHACCPNLDPWVSGRQLRRGLSLDLTCFPGHLLPPSLPCAYPHLRALSPSAYVFSLPAPTLWTPVLQELQLGHSEAPGHLCHWATQPLQEPAAVEACRRGAL